MVMIQKHGILRNEVFDCDEEGMLDAYANLGFIIESKKIQFNEKSKKIQRLRLINNCYFQNQIEFNPQTY